ncbi:HpcH/HpaI aldolase/citrate lyase family protein [Clostridium sediminicola]|uniref:HpcH/HpaI aldolase/citrate lyase family protein n=1 Tax=Clostridium sediminicola TaxID=3114879 RepID=UPI003D169802
MKKFRRTMLFMPGNNPGMLQSATVFGADSIILDLEDAVSISEKDSARILVRDAIKNLDYSSVEVIVRINAITTEFALEDIDVIGKVKPDGLMIPKATEKDMEMVDAILTSIEEKKCFPKNCIKLIPIVESAYGLENVYKIIKSSKRTVAVLLGGEDLTADMGIKRTKEGNEIFYARNKVAVACKASRVDCVDTPFTDVNDKEGLIKDTILAKSLGVTGKAAINPRQVNDINEVFAPSIEEIRYAKRVLKGVEEAEKEGKGVFAIDGKMVDAPVINRAKTVMEIANLLGLCH